MKLNLGCGWRHLKGFTNVDVDPKMKPDLVDNVTTLEAIKGSSVDYLMSQHLFEHLYTDEINTALKNWFRVLKAGGTLSIECPELEKCIKLIMANSVEANFFGFVGIYGSETDAKKYGIFHMHKYCWSFNKLKFKLEQVGFVNIVRAELEQKWRCKQGLYKRDMRIVAEKPSV